MIIGRETKENIREFKDLLSVGYFPQYLSRAFFARFKEASFRWRVSKADSHFS
jgi:hypothetical protein